MNALSFFIPLFFVYVLCHFLFYMCHREQQWHEEQEQILDALNGIEEETKIQVEQLPQKRYFYGVFIMKNLNINKSK